MSVLPAYLDEFLELRDVYDDDFSDALHQYCDGTVCGMQVKDMEAIFNSCGGVFKCIKNYIDEYGELDFSEPQYDLQMKLAYVCILNYINENIEDAVSTDETDEDILVIDNLNIN
jgi:hypothetical protein